MSMSILAPLGSILRETLSNDPEYKVCSLSRVKGHVCGGRITWEHAIYYVGKRLQTRWAIIPLCAKYHSVDQFQDNGLCNKAMNRWAALNRATDEELNQYPRAHFIEERERLNIRFGKYLKPIVL